jgi:hypothetical protein
MNTDDSIGSRTALDEPEGSKVGLGISVGRARLFDERLDE